jgi:hypothetical protein
MSGLNGLVRYVWDTLPSHLYLLAQWHHLQPSCITFNMEALVNSKSQPYAALWHVSTSTFMLCYGRWRSSWNCGVTSLRGIRL